MIFSKQSLKRSVTPIIFVVLACLLVWIWGNHHKVDIALTVRPEVSSFETPVRVDMTILENSEAGAVAASFSHVLRRNALAVENLRLRPGTYVLRGIVTLSSGQTRIVTQSMIVPESNASIEVYLREQ